MVAVLDPEQFAKDTAESLQTLFVVARDERKAVGVPIRPYSPRTLELRNLVIKTVADMLVLHKITVARARATDDVDEIAGIWSDALKTFEPASRAIDRILERIGTDNSDLVYLQKAVIDLRDQARWAYDLHSGGDPEAD